MNLLALYLEFLKIGFFSIGGGLATLPFLYDMAARYDWLTPENIGNFLAIAQCTPGALGVNTCAQTGYLAAGIPGTIIAPLGLISPAIIVIVLVARVLAAFKENSAVQAASAGMRPAAAGLISAAGFGVIILSLYSMNTLNGGTWYEAFRWKEIIMFGVFFFLVWKFKKHPLFYIAAASVAGILLKL